MVGEGLSHGKVADDGNAMRSQLIPGPDAAEQEELGRFEGAAADDDLAPRLDVDTGWSVMFGGSAPGRLEENATDDWWSDLG